METKAGLSPLLVKSSGCRMRPRLRQRMQIEPVPDTDSAVPLRQQAEPEVEPAKVCKAASEIVRPAGNADGRP